MLDLCNLLLAHNFPEDLERVRRSFARQPDNQTCGAAALRHGLLLGGLSVPAAALEAILDIRANQGTAPAALQACLRRLGLSARLLRKPARQGTEAFLDGLKDELARGAFLLPCIYLGEHWACLGAWRDGRAWLIDSFFGKPGLGFRGLTPAELDALDWAHFIVLAGPGRWRGQYEAWLPARPALLRLHSTEPPHPGTIAHLAQSAAHHYLNNEDYTYPGINLHLTGGGSARVVALAPGEDAVGVERARKGKAEVVVVRRLRGQLDVSAPPELVVRASALCGANLGEARRARPAHAVRASRPRRVPAAALPRAVG